MKNETIENKKCYLCGAEGTQNDPDVYDKTVCLVCEAKIGLFKYVAVQKALRNMGGGK